MSKLTKIIVIIAVFGVFIISGLTIDRIAQENNNVYTEFNITDSI